MYDWAEFRHFRYLLAILEKRGLRAASEELHTSQPNLTVQARQFQENAGVRLFRRSKAGHIRPTEAGTAFKVLARYLLDVRAEVIEALVSIERDEIKSISCGSSSLVDQQVFRSLCSLHRTLLPSAEIHSTHGAVPQLIEDIQMGQVDVALVTLPLAHPDLHVEELRRDRLVACVRKDSPLARKTSLVIGDLQEHLRVFYHPQRHPDAHNRLLELLGAAGVQVREYSRASHPYEMQELVKQGFGIALIREGAPLDEQLTTRPVVGVEWTVDTALIYHKQRYPKTVPVLVRQMQKQFGKGLPKFDTESDVLTSAGSQRRPNESVRKTIEEPEQLRLLG